MSSTGRKCLRRLRDDAPERGSVSIFVVVAAVGMLITAGLVVDGGGKIRALQRADAVAEEAARQGGQAIVAGPAIRGEAVQVQAADARDAAAAYLSTAGVAGAVTVLDGTRLRVDATTSYSPVFLSLIGVGPMTTTGHAEVRLVRSLNGER